MIEIDRQFGRWQGRTCAAAPAFKEPGKDAMPKMSAWKQSTTVSAIESGETVHGLFEREAAANPHAGAVSFQGNEVSYRDLNERANRIAHALLQSGLQRGQPVAVMTDDDPWQIAVLLGVFKAGGAIVCLDAEHPPARLHSVLAETLPPFLITGGSCIGRARELAAAEPLSGTTLLTVDPDAVRLERDGRPEKRCEFLFETFAADNPALCSDPRDPVYIVYTSGSTGTPKGIVQSHRSFCQFIRWQSEQFGIRSQRRLAQWASVSYDAGYRQIFGTLCFGGTLCMAPPSIRYNAAALTGWLRDERIAILNVVPSFCIELVAALHAEADGDWQARLPHLDTLLLTGEVVPAGLARAWRALFPAPRRLFNLYGPSECILATCHEIDVVPEEQRSIPIGRAIGGRDILLVNEENKQCAPGEIGEIFVRSDYLTNGYFARQEETATRFVRNPCEDEDLRPVYRTGDLARWSPAGLLEFAGRTDSQVKLRGMRVELGEIEAALGSVDQVETCAVLVKSVARKPSSLIAKDRDARKSAAGSDQQMLVAFITAPGRLSTTNLRSRLADVLPGHMVPQRFVQLDRLPVNANKKIDRKALAELDLLQFDDRKPYVAPRNDGEATLCAIWKEVFGVKAVGINDSFFELGGDSLLAMQVLNRVRRETGIALSFRQLLDNQSIAELAPLIEHPAAGARRVVRTARTAAGREGLPLTLPQQAIWFLWKLEPENPYYTGQGTLRLRGDFSLPVFEKAWSALLDRHEILRVRFGTDGELPTQRFDTAPEKTLTCTDLTGMPEEEQWQTIEAAASARTKSALDLQRDPLFQAQLFRLSPSEHRVLLTFHEIVLDLWGLSVLIRDFTALYEGFSRAEKFQLPPPEMTFGEYAAWEYENVRRPDLDEQAAYWRDELSGELPVLELPRDRPRPVSPSYRGASRSMVLGIEESQKLRELASSRDATLFMTLLAAFKLLMRTYSGQDDIIVGAPLANRIHPGAEDLAGFFLNMLPLRTKLDDDPHFVDLLASVRETVTNAICNAEYPFMWMLEDIEVTRDPSVTPVFQVMFNMLNLPQASTPSAKLDVAYDEIDTPYIKYDLCLYSQEHEGQIYLELAYLTDLFDEATIQRMLDNFRVLLNNVTATPEAPLSRLSCLSNSEKETLLLTWNDTERDYGNDRCIHELFEAQVEQGPGRVALICGAQEMTFGELNLRANQLAHHLREVGVTRQTRVAICMERSLEMMIGLMAIMKAGGTYVALDPDYPSRRLNGILADTAPDVLLLQDDLDRFNNFPRVKVRIDADGPQIAQRKTTNPDCVSSTSDVFNIVYTSSTTGSPKGVLIGMDAVLNRLFWMWESCPFGADTVAVLQKSYALVAATWECFGAMLKGFPTLILTRQEMMDPAELWRRLVAHRVTHFLASPVVYEGVLAQAEAHPGQWQSLRLATTSAEPVAPAMIRRWYAAFPDTPLLNLYGSTECSSNAAGYDTRQLPDTAQRVPIGVPIANTRAYVLDKRHELCPIGAAGELYVAGRCLARGYLNRPELAAECFLPDPYSDEPGARIYKTGDLARYRADGYLELLGRADRQVNIRGFRVELNDVENTLLQHGAVRRCAVILHEFAPGDSRLLAYVVCATDTVPAALREFLRDRLPDYMLPADYVFLASLPLTAAGKLDSRALPVPDMKRPGSASSYAAPVTAVEQALASAWAELLGRESIGVNDNFFDLGGHSLMASRMLFRVKEKLGVEVALKTVFEGPTIAALASHIEIVKYVRASSANEMRREEGEEIVL